MTRKLLVPALVLGLATASFAQDDLARGAQEAYAAGEYAQALDLYDSLAQERTSASLLFNIGNCHSKLNDVPRAILYYERALRLSPGAEDIQANLDLARSKTIDRVNELPAFTLGSAWDRLRGGKDVDQWARRSLWLVLISCALGTAALFVRGRAARVVGGLALLGGLATLTCIGLAAYRVSEANDRSEAIIMAPKVDVVSEPRSTATKLFVIHAGTKLRVLQEQDGWYEVKLASGSVGWAPPGSLERI
ncbi:MAG TPA: SH3 domain-containing protein [Flavobacteriales bacterium]